jgi:hypothetical protein
MSGYGKDFILESINIFEQIGFISSVGIIYCYDGGCRKDKEIKNKSYKTAENIVFTLKSLITNHLTTGSPCYDGHIIEISEAIYLLSVFNEIEFINRWIREIVDHISYAYKRMGLYFPIDSDSFDDLVALNISDKIKKEKLFQLSTLLPILAQWCISLNLNDTYKFIRRIVSEVFPNCDLQIWYPDDTTDQYLYATNAGNKTGATDESIKLKESIDDMIRMNKKVGVNTIKPEQISSIKHGLPILPWIASRHFRTPVLPFYWKELLLCNIVKQKPADSGLSE